MKKALRLFLTGNMQGIFFNEFLKKNAQEFKVNGFMRHREDGRIEIFMEGQSEQVNAFAEICKKGPKYASVRKIEEQDEKLQDFKEFKILKF